MMSDLRIRIEHIGPAATHNVICWLCNERKAVYRMYPVWCFSPCWECDRQIGGMLIRKRKWWRR